MRVQLAGNADQHLAAFSIRGKRPLFSTSVGALPLEPALGLENIRWIGPSWPQQLESRSVGLSLQKLQTRSACQSHNASRHAHMKSCLLTMRTASDLRQRPRMSGAGVPLMAARICHPSTGMPTWHGLCHCKIFRRRGNPTEKELYVRLTLAVANPRKITSFRSWHVCLRAAVFTSSNPRPKCA